MFTNGRPSLRVDDPGLHAACCGPNTWTATEGSATVFINNKAAHRLGDGQKHCGGNGKLVEGSHNVIVGGGSSGGGGGSGGGAGGSAGSGGGTSSGSGASSGINSNATGTSGSGAGSNPPPGSTPTGPREDRPDTPIEPDQIEVRVVDAKGDPVGGIAYELAMPDGSTKSGFAGADGVIKLTELTQRGECKLTFASIDDKARKS